MKKVIVIGCPGSGKSTFSKKLHNLTKIPLYHLDMMYWNSDKTTVEKSVFLKRLENTLKLESFIIDGNFASTLEERLKNCDTVIFLDFPTDVCLCGVKSRKGTVRSDIPWVETEDDTEFLDFIKNFNHTTRPQIINLLNKYSNKNIYTFKTRLDADNFLLSL